MQSLQWPGQKASIGWSHVLSEFLATIAGLSHWFRLWVRQFKSSFDLILTRRVHLSRAPAYSIALREFVSSFPLANNTITWRNDVWLFWHHWAVGRRGTLQHAFYHWRSSYWVSGGTKDISSFMIVLAQACHQEPIGSMAPNGDAPAPRRPGRARWRINPFFAERLAVAKGWDATNVLDEQLRFNGSQVTGHTLGKCTEEFQNRFLAQLNFRAALCQFHGETGGCLRVFDSSFGRIAGGVTCLRCSRSTCSACLAEREREGLFICCLDRIPPSSVASGPWA